MEVNFPERLAALAHPHRLSVFRLLMRRYPDGVPAGELAEALDVKRSTLSTYVAALMRAGLITQKRDCTTLRYAIDMQAVRSTVDYLLFDCCRGRPELCSLSHPADQKGPNAMTDKRYNVLFICTKNSARSIFAEALLREIGGDRFDAYSAGTTPNSELNPYALQILEQNGHDVSRLRSKHVSEFQAGDSPAFDFVFTVCDQAANEECPAWSGQPVSAHWGMPDPVKVEGTNAEKSLAFQRTYGAMRKRIELFAALPFDALDRVALQKAVDDIDLPESPESE